MLLKRQDFAHAELWLEYQEKLTLCIKCNSIIEVICNSSQIFFFLVVVLVGCTAVV